MAINLNCLENFLGEGAYSWVYSLKNSQYAIKISKQNNQFILNQYKILVNLYQINPNIFPKIITHGFLTNQGQYPDQCTDSSQFFIMERLGISLEEFMIIRGNLNITVILQIGKQLIGQLSLLLQHKIKHNDVKPGNILFGNGIKRSQVYLIDYGFSQNKSQFKDNRETFRGNLLYSSSNRLKGRQDFKDDIESFIYLMIWMLKDGYLPWSQFTQQFSSRNIQNIINNREKFIINLINGYNQQLNRRQKLLYELALILNKIYSQIEGSLNAQTLIGYLLKIF